MSYLLIASSLTSSVDCKANVTAFNSVDLQEMTLLSELSLPDKSLAFFNLTITDNVYSRFKKGVHLSFNVYPTRFGSDPDIYVSKVSLKTLISIIRC